VTLADYLAAVQALGQRRTTLDAAIAKLVAVRPGGPRTRRVVPKRRTYTAIPLPPRH
jgi:hypothetical protein